MKYFDKLNHFVAIVKDGVIVYVNPAGSRMMTLETPDDLMGRRLEMFVSPEYADVIALGLDTLAAEPESLPLKLVSANNTQIDAKMWVDNWESEIPDNTFLVEIHDVSAHMRAALTLKEREHKLSQIIASVADGIISVDGNGKISSLNPAAEKIFGFSADEIMGMDISDLAPEITDILARGEELQDFHEIYVQRKEGSRILVEFAGRTLPLGEGQIFTWVIRDITARREREDRERNHLIEAEEQSRVMEQQAAQMAGLVDELYTLKQTAESADELKSRFLASMSHELRTPLNAIIGFSEVMKGEMFGPLHNAQYLDYSDSIHTSGTYLLKLINDILDISKIEAGAQELFEEKVNLRSVIVDCMEMVRERAADAGTNMALTAGETPTIVLADPRRVKQIVLNLLTNAIKFSPEGGDIAAVISSAPNGDGRDAVSVKIEDNGKGIKTEDIEMVLKPFGQINDLISRDQEGTGLGLPLCKQLMELHGGTLLMESEVGTGSAVTITFPSERTVYS
jgi:PAS domain S-box-containing protein